MSASGIGFCTGKSQFSDYLSRIKRNHEASPFPNTPFDKKYLDSRCAD
jgi:hypothetical protein